MFIEKIKIKNVTTTINDRWPTTLVLVATIVKQNRYHEWTRRVLLNPIMEV